MTRLAIAITCCALAVALGADVAHGQGASETSLEAAPAPRELRYFRVEVPADHEEEWEKLYFGFVPHRFPIPSAEFERLLQTSRATTTPGSPTVSRIVALRGDAQLFGDALIGTAELEIITAATERTLLSLAGSSWAIASAQWEDGRAAALGSTPDGAPIVVVEQPGKLRISWSLRGQRTADKRLRFDLSLPPCQNTRLELLLPREFEAASSRGLLTEQTAANDGQRRWALELGSLSRTQLAMGAPQPATPGRNLWLVNQRCDYSLNAQGLTLVSELFVQPLAATSMGLLKLRADAGLQLTSAEIDGQPVEWDILKVNHREEILLSLEPPRGTASTTSVGARKVVLTALGEFPLGKPQALPAIRPLDVVWQAGRASVSVAAPLQIAVLELPGGRVAGLGQSPDKRTSTLEFFEPTSRATLACQFQAAALSASSTYVWQLTPEAISARWFAELSAVAGSIHELNVELAPGWKVEPQDVRVLVAGNGSSSGGALAEGRVIVGPDKLLVSLDAPLSRQQPLRLEVTARRDFPLAAQAMQVGDLQFARFSPAVLQTNIGLATTAAPYRVRLSGGPPAARVPRESIAPAAFAALPAAASYTALVIDDATRRQTLEVVRDPPRVDVGLEVLVTADRLQLAESYEFELRPDATGVDRLRFSFWPPRASPLEWAMTTSEELPVIQFDRLAETPAQDAPEIWEVKFHERQVASFRLSASRSSPMPTTGPLRVCLASVEEATAQVGRVVVQSPGNVPLQFTARKLRPIAPPAASQPRLAVRGAYRYEPARAMAAGDASLAVDPVPLVQQAWAWQLHVESVFGERGAAVHRATWLVQNEGAATVRLRMPPGSTRHVVEIDGQAVSAQDDARGGITVPLPPASAPLSVSVDYTSAAPQLGAWGRLDAPLPQLDLPVLSRTWRVALPAGYVANRAASAQSESLGERMWGPWFQRAAAGLMIRPNASAAWLELPLPAAGDAVLLVQRHDWLVGLRLSLLLLALAAAWWPWRLPLSLLLAASLLAAAVAACAPPVVSVGASGIFLGLLLGAALRLLSRRSPHATLATTELIAPKLAAPALLLILAALGAACIGGHAQAADTPAAPLDQPYPVWIPVNEKREPTGEVYLPQAFYDQLQARARAAAAAPRDWLLLGATYDLRLDWQASPTVLAAEELRISYDLELLAPSTGIVLPLPRAGVASDEAWATLDGQPLELSWREGESSLRVPVAEIGKHRLELRVRPTPAVPASGLQLDLAIVPAMNARLQVTAPLDAPDVQVLQAHGAVQRTSATLPLATGGEQQVARWQAGLGQVGRLQLNWPRQPVETAPAAQFTVEEMSWLNLSSEPRLEVKFRCEVQHGALSEMLLVAPAELKLLPAVAKWNPVATSDGLSTYRLALEKPADKEAIVRALFQLPGPWAWGRSLVPAVHLRGAASISKSSLAVSLPQDCELAPAAALKAAKLDEFVRRWGDASAAPPAHVFLVEPTAGAPQFLLRPTSTPPAVRETLHVNFAAQQARLDLTAEIEPALSPRHVLELATPADFVAEQVTAFAAADDTASDDALAWWSASAGKVRLFLQQPQTTTLTIRVTGAVKISTGEVALPLLRMNDMRCTWRSVEISRDAAVLAEIASAPGYAVQDASGAALSGGRGRSVATLIDQSPAAATAQCLLKLVLNHPAVAGHQITALLRRDDSWLARVELHLQVAEGVVDVLRLQLPADFGPQWTIDPPLAQRLTESSDGAGRELTLTPERAIAGEFRVVLQAPCAASSGQKVQVPDIRVREMAALARYLVVPRALDEQNIQWQTDRLQALGDDRRAALGLLASDTIAYRVAGDPFRAELKALRREAGAPLVGLADVRCALQPDGTAAGWATFDLQPAGLTSCTLVVPAPYRLVYVRTDGMAAQVRPVSSQRWRIAVGQQGMPQRIEVFYTGQLSPRAAQPLAVAAPLLEKIDVAHTLWTIHAPAVWGDGVPRAGGKLSVIEQDLVRLQSLTEVLRLPRDLRVEASVRELSDWFSRWEGRWQAVRKTAPLAALPRTAAWKDIDDAHAQAIADAPTDPALVASAAAAAPFSQFSVPAGAQATRSGAPGTSATMVVDFSHGPVTGDSPLRWVVAAMLCAAGAALLLAQRFWRTGDWLLRSGRAIGVAVGLAWALWLWPSWVGWLVVLAFVLPDGWPRWRRKADEAGSAIVVRSGSRPRGSSIS